jgi:hypothetical protein
VLGGGLTFTQMRMSAVDSQTIEQLKWTAETVCSTFHVPPWKVGIGAQPAYTKPEIANQAYYSDCLQSPIEQWELCMDEAFGFDTTKVEGRWLGVELDLDGLLRMDMASQIETLGKAVGGSVLTVNEARAKVDQKPVAGGDSIWMQQQNYSLDALAERDRNDPFAPARPAPARARTAEADHGGRPAPADRRADGATRRAHRHQRCNAEDGRVTDDPVLAAVQRFMDAVETRVGTLTGETRALLTDAALRSRSCRRAPRRAGRRVGAGRARRSRACRPQGEPGPSGVAGRAGRTRRRGEPGLAGRDGAIGPQGERGATVDRSGRAYGRARRRWSRWSRRCAVDDPWPTRTAGRTRRGRHRHARRVGRDDRARFAELQVRTFADSYREVYRAGEQYRRGETVTWGGSLFLAMATPRTSPRPRQRGG